MTFDAVCQEHGTNGANRERGCIHHVDPLHLSFIDSGQLDRDQGRRSVPRITSPTVGDWAPGHSIQMIAPGTRHSANSTAPVPTVTLAPNAMLVTTISATAVNQICITFARVITFMVFTLSVDTFRLGVDCQIGCRASALRPQLKLPPHELA
jgi:hypothetical protein